MRMFTTVTQIGVDPGLLLGYGAGASLNLTLMIQGILYREQVWWCGGVVVWWCGGVVVSGCEPGRGKGILHREQARGCELL